MRFQWAGWVAIAACTSTPSDPDDSSPPDRAPLVDTAPIDTAPQTDTANPPPLCEAPEALGPWPEHPIAVNASVQRGPLEQDSGLAAVRSKALAAPQPVAVSLAVSSARVTAVTPAASQDALVTVWIEDSSGPIVAIEVDTDGGTAPGDRVNFTATEVVNVSGRAQVNTLVDYDVDGVGTALPVIDGATTPLTYAEHGERLVEVWGQLTTQRPPCDGNDCFDFTDSNGAILVYRSPAGARQIGDCVHFIGPLQQLDGELLLDVAHPDWNRPY